MNNCGLTANITALACIIAQDKTPEELSLMSSICMQFGDTLGTIAAQQTLCAAKQTSGTNTNHTIETKNDTESKEQE